MASGDRGLAAPLCDHSRCVGSPREADVSFRLRVSNQARSSRCDVPLCERVSIQSRPALIGFEADGAPVENISSALRSRRHAIRWASQNVASRYLPQGGPWSAGKAWVLQGRAGQRGPWAGRKTGLAWPLRSRPIPPLPCSVSPWRGRGRSAGRSGRCWPRSPCAMRPRRRRPEPPDGQGFPSPGASCPWPPERP